MAVESIQCPKCGAPLGVEPGREHTYCSYCGAGLKLAVGVSGHPMAVLDDIKTDTSIIAKEVALRRLAVKVNEKQMARQSLVLTRDSERKALPRSSTDIPALFFAVGALITMIGFCFLAAAVNAGDPVGLGVGFVVIGFFIMLPFFAYKPGSGSGKRREGLRRIAELEAQIDALSQEIEDLHKKIQAQRADMDALADQV